MQAFRSGFGHLLSNDCAGKATRSGQFIAGFRCHGTTQAVKNAGYSVQNTFTKVPFLEFWYNPVFDDAIGIKIRQFSFQAITHFYTNLPIVLCYQEKHSIILSFLADFPFFYDSHGVVLYLQTFQGVYCEHHYLIRGGFFMSLQKAG